MLVKLPVLVRPFKLIPSVVNVFKFMSMLILSTLQLTVVVMANTEPVAVKALVKVAPSLLMFTAPLFEIVIGVVTL